MKNKKTPEEKARDKAAKFFVDNVEKQTKANFLIDQLDEDFSCEKLKELFEIFHDLVVNYINKTYMLHESQYEELLEKTFEHLNKNWNKWIREKYNIQQFICYQAFCARTQMKMIK